MEGKTLKETQLKSCKVMSTPPLLYESEAWVRRKKKI
jgi:hypothetical protein